MTGGGVNEASSPCVGVGEQHNVLIAVVVPSANFPFVGACVLGADSALSQREVPILDFLQGGSFSRSTIDIRIAPDTIGSGGLPRPTLIHRPVLGGIERAKVSTISPGKGPPPDLLCGGARVQST